MHGADPLRPHDRIDADGTRRCQRDEDVLHHGCFDGDQDDVADTGEAFDLRPVSKRTRGRRVLLLDSRAMAASHEVTLRVWMSQPMMTRQVQPNAYVGFDLR